MTFFADPPEWDEPPEQVTITDGSEEVTYYPLSDVLTAYPEGGQVYILCDRPDCLYHDGDGCGLESVIIRHSMCNDYERSADG